MNPDLVNKLKLPLRKQALAFIFLCGFGFARIKVTLALFVWISMKTSNPLLCNIPYFNNFNNYCFLFLIKSSAPRPLSVGKKVYTIVKAHLGGDEGLTRSVVAWMERRKWIQEAFNRANQ